MKTVRVFFEKRGRSKYISHLDLNRCLQRSLRRSDLPVWYTEGFHPHMYLAFSLPLSLGYESLRESMDLKLTEEVEEKAFLAAFNEALPEGIRALELADPVMKPEKIRWAAYDCSLYFPGRSAEELENLWNGFTGKDAILVTKKTKRGEHEIDLKPVFRVDSAAGEEGVLRLSLMLRAGNELNINPSLLFDAFCADSKMELDHLDVLRKQIYAEDFEVFA